MKDMRIGQFPGWELHMLREKIKGKNHTTEKVVLGIQTNDLPEARAIRNALNRAADAEVKPTSITLNGRLICTIQKEGSGYTYLIPYDVRQILYHANLIPWREKVC